MVARKGKCTSRNSPPRVPDLAGAVVRDEEVGRAQVTVQLPHVVQLRSEPNIANLQLKDTQRTTKQTVVIYEIFRVEIKTIR